MKKIYIQNFLTRTSQNFEKIEKNEIFYHFINRLDCKTWYQKHICNLFLGQIWPILMEIFIFWELGDRTNQEIECKIAPSSLLVTLLSWNLVFELEFNHRIGRVSKKYNLKKKIKIFWPEHHKILKKSKKKWNFLSLHKSFGLQDLVSKTHMQSFFGSNMAYIDGNIHILRTRRQNEPGDRV